MSPDRPRRQDLDEDFDRSWWRFMTVVCVAAVAFWAVVIYVAVHFITKWW